MSIGCVSVGVMTELVKEMASCNCGDNCQCENCSCASVLSTSLSPAQATALASGFAALADPVRLRLFSLLATAPEGAISVCDLISPLGKSQSTVSHHMKVLAEAGLVSGDKNGRLISYRVVDDQITALKNAVDRTHAHV